MATVVKSFQFSANAENWVGHPQYSESYYRNTTYGNPSASLAVASDMMSGMASKGYWEWTGTWEQLGVPSGKVVTSLAISVDEKLQTGGYQPCEFGPYSLHNSSGTKLGDFLAIRTTGTSSETSWTTRSTSDLFVGTPQASSTTIKLRAYMGADASGSSLLLMDNLTYTITHEDPLPPGTYTGTSTLSNMPYIDNETFDMLVHLKFDEPSGTAVLDKMGNVSGNIVGSSTRSSDTPAVFNGGGSIYVANSGGVTIASSPVLRYDATKPGMTASIWFKNTGAMTGDRIIVEHGAWPNWETWQIAKIGTSTIRCTFAVSNLHLDVDAGTKLTDGEWHHIAFTSDRSSRLSIVYIDGIEAGRIVASTVPTQTVNRATHIGSRSGTGIFWPGYLDDFRFYDKVLSPEEIGHISTGSDRIINGTGPIFYSGEATITTSSEPETSVTSGLLGHWKFNGSGIDSSGNEKNATLHGQSTANLPGKFGNALEVHDYWSYARFPQINRGRPISIAFWWNTPSPTLWSQSVISPASEHGPMMHQGTGRMAYRENGTWKLISSTVMSANTWYHFTYTIDDSGNGTIYVNGVQEAMSTGMLASPVGWQWFGGEVGYYSAYGKIDDARIYNRVISPGEIQKLLSKRSVQFNASGSASIIYGGIATISKKPTVVSTGSRTTPTFSGTSAITTRSMVGGFGGWSLPNYLTSPSMFVQAAVSALGGVTTPVSESIPLFVRGSEGNETIRSQTLHTKGHEPSSSSFPMFVDGIGYTENSISLHAINFEDSSAIIPMNVKGMPPQSANKVDLFILGDEIDKFILGNRITMITSGYMQTESLWPHIPLIIKGPTGISVSVPLITQGPRPFSRSMPLVALGDDFKPYDPCADWNSEWGPCPDKRRVPLFLKTIEPFGRAMNLMVAAPPAPFASASLAMAVAGHSVHSSIVSSMPLHTYSEEPMSGRMNLYTIGGAGTGTNTRQMSLVVWSENPQAMSSIPLIVGNNYGMEEWFLDLFVRGAGGMPGYKPAEGRMNLYIERGGQQGITMFLQNNDVIDSLTLVASGAGEESDIMPMVILGYGDMASGDITLAIPNVTAPTPFWGDVTLVVPETVGHTGDNLKLYTHGFQI